MKKFLYNFRLAVRFFVSLTTSREFAFIFVLFGVIAQISHTYFLVESISSLDGTYRTIQATFIAFFISASLLYFVAITPKLDDDGIENDNIQRIINAVTVFTIIEIVINIYYYTRHLLLDESGNFVTERLLDFCFAIIVSVLIPWTIKLYSSQIRAKEWGDEFEDKKTESSELILQGDSVSEEVVSQILDEKLAEFLKENKDSMITEESLLEIFGDKMKEVDETVRESFSKNQKLFLNQFEQKLKTIASQTKLSEQN